MHIAITQAPAAAPTAPVPTTWHVSDVILAAIIAAGIAFLSSALTNRHSRKQFERQLAADARERQIEREMALRRDVYLPAIEAVTRCSGVLGQLTNTEADLKLIERGLVADLATIAKVHLVASEETSRHMMAFLAVFMPAYLEMHTARAPLVVRRHAITLQQSFIDRADAEVQVLVQTMKQHNLAGNKDPGTWDRLNRMCQAAQATVHNHVNEQAKLWTAQNADQLELTKKCADLARSTWECMPDALISARQELGLPTNATEFRRLFNAQQAAALKAMDDLIARMRQLSK